MVVSFLHYFITFSFRRTQALICILTLTYSSTQFINLPSVLFNRLALQWYIWNIVHITYWIFQKLRHITTVKHSQYNAEQMLPAQHSTSPVPTAARLPALTAQTAPCHLPSSASSDSSVIQTPFDNLNVFQRSSLCPVAINLCVLSSYYYQGIIITYHIIQYTYQSTSRKTELHTCSWEERMSRETVEDLSLSTAAAKEAGNVTFHSCLFMF